MKRRAFLKKISFAAAAVAVWPRKKTEADVVDECQQVINDARRVYFSPAAYRHKMPCKFHGGPFDGATEYARPCEFVRFPMRATGGEIKYARYNFCCLSKGRGALEFIYVGTE